MLANYLGQVYIVHPNVPIREILWWFLKLACYFFQLVIMISGAILSFSLTQGKAMPHSFLYQIIGRHILADVLTYTY